MVYTNMGTIVAKTHEACLLAHMGQLLDGRTLRLWLMRKGIHTLRSILQCQDAQTDDLIFRQEMA